MKKLINAMRANAQTIVIALLGLNFVGLITAIAMLGNLYAKVNEIQGRVDVMTYLELAETVSEDDINNPVSWVFDTMSKLFTGVAVDAKNDGKLPTLDTLKKVNAAKVEYAPEMTTTTTSETAKEEAYVFVTDSMTEETTTTTTYVSTASMETSTTTTTITVVQVKPMTAVPTETTTAAKKYTTTRSTTSTTQKVVEVKTTFTESREKLEEHLAKIFHDGETVEVKNVPYYECYTTLVNARENELVMGNNPEWEYVLTVRTQNGKIANSFILARSGNFVDVEFPTAQSGKRRISNVIQLEGQYYTADAIIEKLLEGSTPPDKMGTSVVWTAPKADGNE